MTDNINLSHLYCFFGGISLTTCAVSASILFSQRQHQRQKQQQQQQQQQRQQQQQTTKIEDKQNISDEIKLEYHSRAMTFFGKNFII